MCNGESDSRVPVSVVQFYVLLVIPTKKLGGTELVNSWKLPGNCPFIETAGPSFTLAALTLFLLRLRACECVHSVSPVDPSCHSRGGIVTSRGSLRSFWSMQFTRFGGRRARSALWKVGHFRGVCKRWVHPRHTALQARLSLGRSELKKNNA